MEETNVVEAAQAPKAVVPFIKGKGLVPQDFDGMYRLANVLSASHLMPKGLESPAAAFVALQLGFELGMSPMQSIQNIAVINNRPVVWGDTMLALVRQSGMMVSFEEREEGEGAALYCTCIVKRKGDEKAMARSFSIKKAMAAGLMGKDSWKKYPGRMCQMRARSWALRDAFPDVLKGIRSPADVDDGDIIDVTPASVSADQPTEKVPDGGGPDYGGKAQTAAGVAETTPEEAPDKVKEYPPDHTARNSEDFKQPPPARIHCARCGDEVESLAELVNGDCVNCHANAQETYTTKKEQVDTEPPVDYEEALNRKIWNHMRSGNPAKGTGYAGWIFSVKATIDLAIKDNWIFGVNLLKEKWNALYPETPWPWDMPANKPDPREEEERKRQQLREDAAKIPERALSGNGNGGTEKPEDLLLELRNTVRRYAQGNYGHMYLAARRSKGIGTAIEDLSIDECTAIIDDVAGQIELEETYGKH